MEQMLNRHDQVYGRYPLKVALDGGFASKKNLEWAKSKEIKDVCFAKKRGISVERMCRSEYVVEAMFWSRSMHLEVTDFLPQLRMGIGCLSKLADNGQKGKCDNLRKSRRKWNANLKSTPIFALF